MEEQMANCHTKSKTVRVCTRTRIDRFHHCIETRDNGYKSCVEKADHGHDNCNSWGQQCSSWGIFSGLCKAFTVICNVWVWISEMVCIAWKWISCVVCIVWAVIQFAVCVAWAVITFVYVSICCAQPLLKGLVKCWKRTKDMPRNPLQKMGWHLTFQDDFDADQIDYTKWRDSMSFVGRYGDHLKEVNETDFANGKFPERYYSPDFTFGPSTVKLIADNTPVKITIPPDPNNPNKWSGEFWVPHTLQALQWLTNPLREQRLGYFEIRCKTQDARDMWPAFWLFPVTPDKSQGPPKTWPPEIDIFEFMTRKPNIFTTTQHWGQDPGHPSDWKRYRACKAGKRFHIYACEWGEKSISWYLDNKLLRTTTKGIGDFIYAMSLIVNSGIDDRACREPEKSRYPNYLEVDYVRVYHK